MLGPRGAVEEMVGEDPLIYTETVLQPSGEFAAVDIYLRFLQTQWRAPQRCVDVAASRFEPVDELRVGATNWIAWHEAVEQEVAVHGVLVEELLAGREVELAIPGSEEVEILRDVNGAVVGRLVRTRYPLTGRMRVVGTTVSIAPPAMVIRVEVENTAECSGAADESRTARRDLAARQSFVGTHVLLTATEATFVSVVDPPTVGGRGQPHAAATRGAGPSWRERGARMSARARSCSARRSSSAITRRSRPRARGSCSTPRRSTRS